MWDLARRFITSQWIDGYDPNLGFVPEDTSYVVTDSVAELSCDGREEFGIVAEL